MKKFLALVLALVMTMSLVTISSSAAYSDAADIDYVEAVNVLSGLGVIDGMGDGTFAPDGSVTRAQMAKMITYIDLGVVTPSAFEGTKTDLTDIEGHWAEAYIKYCYSQGIIAGKGDGKFDPEANVTTAEAAKMLLVALGWDATVQGYIGEQWQVNTIRDAHENDILDDVANLGAEKALNRDEAAKLIYNTILTPVVKKISSKDRVDGGIGDTWEKDVQNGTLLGNTFNSQRYVGKLTSIGDYDHVKGLYAYNVDDFKVISAAGNGGSDVLKAAEDYTELLGEEVNVVIRKAGTSDEAVLGIYPTGDTKAEYAFVSSLGATAGKLKVNGTAYAVENVYGSESLTALQTSVLNDELLNSYNIIKVTDLDEDGKLDFAHTYTYYAEKVIHADSSYIVTERGDDMYYAEDAIAEGIVEGDYVSYTEHFNDVWVVEKIAPFEAVVSATKNDVSSVQFDGVWYNDGDAKVAGTWTTTRTLTAGDTHRIWALNGVIVANKQISGSSISNLVLVYAKDTNDVDGNRVSYIDAEGVKHKGVYIDGSDKTVTNPSVGTLYFASVTDDGVDFDPVGNVGDPADPEYTYSGVGTYTLGVNSDSNYTKIDGYDITSDAVVFVMEYDGGTVAKDAAVISGNELKNLDDTAQAKITSTDGTDYFTKSNVGGKFTKATHVAIKFNGDISEDLNALSGKEVYAYVTEDAVNKKVDGKDYIEYKLWNGSENLVVLEKGNDRSIRKAGDVIRYGTVDADGYIKEVAGRDTGFVADSGAVYNDSGFDKSINIDGTTYKVTSDTKFLYVNSGAAKPEEIGKLDGAVREARGLLSGSLIMPNIARVATLKNNDWNLDVVVVDVMQGMRRADTKVKVDVSLKNYTDSVWVIEGDIINFDFGTDANGNAVTKSISGVYTATDKDGSVSITGKGTVYAMGFGNAIA